MKRIGLLGGSFNPIHFGHLLLAEQAAEALALSRVVFIPAKIPPHKLNSHLAAAKHRLAMAKLATAGNPLFDVSDFEINRAGPSYTIQTAEHFQKIYRDEAELCFLIGSDTLRDLPTWHRAAELVRKITFVSLSRPGAKLPSLRLLSSALGLPAARDLLARVIQMPELDISASDIRRRAADGRTIRYMLPEPVRKYILRNHLYRNEHAL